MPALSEWVNALTTPRHVTIESSQALLASIQTKQAQHNARLQARGHLPASSKGTLAVVAHFDPRRTVQLEPIRILHRLGVITTPIVPNLTDISSTWAYIRYLWAFEPPDGTQIEPLRLSDAALGIDFHQKALMSDQIGIGMAALIMELYFNASDAADVAVVLDERILPVELAHAASPDYLFSNADRTAYYVVECKGTRCSRSVALQQLRRGTEQATSLRFTDGRQPPIALVIGTRLTEAKTEILIVDPPPDEEEQERETRQDPRGLGPKERWISDSKKFQQDIGRASALKVLGYAGADQTARDIATRRWPSVADAWPTRARRTVVRKNVFGEFFGVQQTLPFRDGVRVEVFQGIVREVLAGHSAHTDEDPEADREELVRRIRTHDPVHVGRVENEDGIGALSLSSDGTILEVRLSEA